MKSLHRHGLKKPWHLHAFAASTLRHSIHDARRAEERYVPLGEHLLAPVDQAVDVLLIASRAGEARTVSPISEIDVTKALEQLQAHEPRAALVLQLRLQGQSLEEVATLLRVTPGAASHLSSLGIRWLRKHLGTEKGKP
jgi:DNA-directed RNA polymerase specialized sigma24 family protein